MATLKRDAGTRSIDSLEVTLPWLAAPLPDTPQTRLVYASRSRQGKGRPTRIPGPFEHINIISARLVERLHTRRRVNMWNLTKGYQYYNTTVFLSIIASFYFRYCGPKDTVREIHNQFDYGHSLFDFILSVVETPRVFVCVCVCVWSPLRACVKLITSIGLL